MAESKPIAIVPLNGSNYPTWKIQCRMALVQEGLWGIVSSTETAPVEGSDHRTKFLSRRDRALATIVLAVDPKQGKQSSLEKYKLNLSMVKEKLLLLHLKLVPRL